MKRNKLSLIVISAACAFMLTACGPSDEKLAEIQNAYTLLETARTSAQTTYSQLTDESLKSELDTLSASVDEIGTHDFTKMSDKKIDELLVTLNEVSANYSAIQDKLDAELQTETAIATEKSKNKRVECYITNRTGKDLNSLKFVDVSQNITYDLLDADQSFANGYTLMGVALNIYDDTTEWKFSATAEDGSNMDFPVESLLGYEESGLSITLSSNDGSMTAVIGSYTDSEAPDAAVETTSDSSAESSSQEATSSAESSSSSEAASDSETASSSEASSQ